MLLLLLLLLLFFDVVVAVVVVVVVVVAFVIGLHFGFKLSVSLCLCDLPLVFFVSFETQLGNHDSFLFVAARINLFAIL